MSELDYLPSAKDGDKGQHINVSVVRYSSRKSETCGHSKREGRNRSETCVQAPLGRAVESKEEENNYEEKADTKFCMQ